MTEVAVTGGFTHPRSADLAGSMAKFALTSATFVRMSAGYAKSNPETMIREMLKEMSTFSGPEMQEKAKEAASDPGRVERLESLMR